jgi:hypothetical protein
VVEPDPATMVSGTATLSNIPTGPHVAPGGSGSSAWNVNVALIVATDPGAPLTLAAVTVSSPHSDTVPAAAGLATPMSATAQPIARPHTAPTARR